MDFPAEVGVVGEFFVAIDVGWMRNPRISIAEIGRTLAARSG